jgi:hypothetical protein
MKETLESELGFFPTDAQAAVILEPGDRVFHGPTPAVSAQGADSSGAIFTFLFHKKFVNTFLSLLPMSNPPRSSGSPPCQFAF